MKSVTAKLANMRKPQDFVVYPQSTDKNIIVQSDRAIGMFDPETGKGVLNYKGSNAKYFTHLVKFMGAEPYTFPEEFVKACLEAQPKSGDLIGSSPITGPVFVK